jgi:hypothetical protein
MTNPTDDPRDDADGHDIRDLHDDGRDVAPDLGFAASAAGAVSREDGWDGPPALPAAGRSTGLQSASGAQGDPPTTSAAVEALSYVVRTGPNGERRATARGLELIEHLAWSKAATDGTIAAQLGVDRSTLRAMRRRQPEVDEALARGRSRLEDALVHSLLRRAMNAKDPSGMAAAAFLLKARCGYREGSVAETAALAISDSTVQVVVAPRLSAEAFRELLDRAEGGR